MLAISVRRKSTCEIEFGRSVGDGIEDAGSDDRADQLRDDVRADEIGWKAASARKPHGDRRVKMTSGEMTDRVGHCQHGQAESQGYTEQSNVSVVEEFINLIVAQRGYEANSKVVKAADDMYQQVNNLTR